MSKSSPGTPPDTWKPPKTRVQAKQCFVLLFCLVFLIVFYVLVVLVVVLVLLGVVLVIMEVVASHHCYYD